MIKNQVLKFVSRSKYILALALMLATTMTALFPSTAAAAGETYLWQTSSSGGNQAIQIIGTAGEFANFDGSVATFNKVEDQANQYRAFGFVRNCGTAGQPRYTITVTGENAGTIATELRGCAAPNLSGAITIDGGMPSGGFNPNPGTGEEGPAQVDEDWCNQAAGDANWWLCVPVDIATDAIALLDCQILDLLKIDTVAIFNAQGTATTAPPNCPARLFDEGAPNEDSEESSTAYRAAWSAFRNVALAILVIFGLIMIASQIMGLDVFDAYTIRKMLPKLIIATIFLTLSWNIMQFLFTASNAAADAVLALIEYPFRNIDANNGATFTNATLAWIIPVLLLTGGGVGAVAAVGLLGFGGVMALLGSLLLAVFSAWVLLVARDVVATALIISSPVWIICAAYEPFEKAYSFGKGITITILLSVPALAGVIGMSHAGALIALVSDNIVVALIILLAGYILLWGTYKQIDKVSGYFGNAMSSVTGRAQKALSNYRNNQVQQRRQEAIEGRRNIPFARTMRRMHLANEAGNGGFLGRQNRARLAAAEQSFMQQSAKKRLEAEGGRMSGDDDAMALAMQRGMTPERFIREYQQRTGRDGRRALADMEASFGADIGTGAMRVAAARARWGSVSAYNDFDIDTEDGARNMYRQMMQDAGEMVADGQMSVTDVVSAMKANNQRADISGHSFPQMMAQVSASANRLQQIRAGAGAVEGRLMDETTGTVQRDAAGNELTVNTGNSVRRTRATRNQAGDIIGGNQVVGQGPNLISNSEIDAWMRGSLEYAQPGALVAGRTETVRVLGNHMRERIDRALQTETQASQAAAQASQQYGNTSPQAVQAQQALVNAERETKRQLAALAGRYEVMGQVSAENARYMADNVMGENVNYGGGVGNVKIQQLVDNLRADPEFQEFRREYYNASMAGAQAQQQAAAAAAGGQPPGQIPTPSDRWLKRDIRHIGTVQNGAINLYRFKYIWSDQEYVGVMAQELLTSHPEAVILASDGFYRVNYEVIGVPFLTYEAWQQQESATKTAQ